MKGVRIIGIIGLAAVCAVPARSEETVPAARVPETPLVKSEGRSAEQPAILYQVAGLIDQNRTDEALALFETARKTDKASPAMLEYLSARLAMAKGQYTEALQHLAQVTVVYSRDTEWAPAALFYEGLIYKQTGHPEAARQTAEELLLGWPESDWIRRAEELK